MPLNKKLFLKLLEEADDKAVELIIKPHNTSSDAPSNYTYMSWNPGYNRKTITYK